MASSSFMPEILTRLQQQQGPAPVAGGGIWDWLQSPAFQRQQGVTPAMMQQAGVPQTSRLQAFGQMLMGLGQGVNSRAGQGGLSALAGGMMGAAGGLQGARSNERQQTMDALLQQAQIAKMLKGDQPQTSTFERLIGNLPPDQQAQLTQKWLQKETDPAPQNPSDLDTMIGTLSGGDPAKAAQLYQERFNAMNRPPAAPSVKVNVAPPGTTINSFAAPQLNKVQEFYGQTFTDLQKLGMDAPTKLGKLDRLDNLLSQVDTGTFAQTGQALKKTLKGIGVDPEALGLADDVAPAEAAQALTREMALELRNPAGGAGMPGAMSDADRQFLASMVPGLETTAQGRRQIIETQRKLIKRDQDVAKMARDYTAKKGSIDQGFYDELSQWSAASPLFSGMNPEGGPAVGVVEDGYRFKGGDPSDPNSWEQVP